MYKKHNQLMCNNINIIITLFSHLHICDHHHYISLVLTPFITYILYHVLLPANECEAESSSVPLERTAKKDLSKGEEDNFSCNKDIKSVGHLPFIILSCIALVLSFRLEGSIEREISDISFSYQNINDT